MLPSFFPVGPSEWTGRFVQVWQYHSKNTYWRYWSTRAFVGFRSVTVSRGLQIKAWHFMTQEISALPLMWKLKTRREGITTSRSCFTKRYKWCAYMYFHQSTYKIVEYSSLHLCRCTCTVISLLHRLLCIKSFNRGYGTVRIGTLENVQSISWLTNSDPFTSQKMQPLMESSTWVLLVSRTLESSLRAGPATQPTRMVHKLLFF